MPQVLFREIDSRHGHVCEDVRIDHEKCLLTERRQGFENTTTGFEELISFPAVNHFEAEPPTRSDALHNLVAEPPEVDDNGLDPRRRDVLEVTFEQSFTADFDE